MNYRDYMEIMAEEELTLPKFAEYTLEGAKECQRIIKALKAETNFDVSKQIKRMEEKKISYILEAIEWAKLAKENPAGCKWAERVYEKQTKRR